MLTNGLARWRSWCRASGRPKRLTLNCAELEAWERRAGSLKLASDGSLKGAAQELKQRIANGGQEALGAEVEAGALVGEVVRRVLGMELFQTQRLAGLIMAQGHIAQMQTGEGKTLAGAVPVLFAALHGQGVHVMLPNVYLAGRDAGLLQPVLELLGIRSGLLQEGDDDRARQRAYECDVTYGAGYDFGFDYLRDQLKCLAKGAEGLAGEFERALRRQEAPVNRLRQRGLPWAIVDEADSILLDEATVPMILSGPRAAQIGDETPFLLAQAVAAELRPGSDFHCDALSLRVLLTESGQAQVEGARAGLRRAKLARPWHDYVEKALAASELFVRDVHYVVLGEKVVIVDEATGRLHADRSWRDGLHQAIEAKEGLPVSGQAETLAQISRQRFLGRYERLCGMTGTALGSERELREVYGLAVVYVPSRRPSARTQLPDRYFRDQGAKRRAAAEAIAAMHESGRPVLVGSRTIQASEAIARLLAERGIDCQVLNGKQSADEADLVARAGQAGMVTVATNMAGRGTDIRLGPGVAELGGLHLVGLERNTSSRADDQLVGRVARQGEAGSFQFFVAADDALLTKFAPRLSGEMARQVDRQGEIAGAWGPRVAQAQRLAGAGAELQRTRLRERDSQERETIGRLFGLS